MWNKCDCEVLFTLVCCLQDVNVSVQRMGQGSQKQGVNECEHRMGVLSNTGFRFGLISEVLLRPGLLPAGV